MSVLSGRLSGLPVGSHKLLEDMEAISLRDASIAAVAVPVRGRYSMRVPRGPYLVVARVENLPGARGVTQIGSYGVRRRGGKTVNFPIRTAKDARSPGVTDQAHFGDARAQISSAAPVVGIGQIAMSSPAQYGIGNNASGGLSNGLVPACNADGVKVTDVSKQVTEAQQREQQLSDQGRTELHLHLNPLSPTVVVQGDVTVGQDGTPTADLKLVDPTTGQTIDHILVRGDPGEAGDISPFLRLVGEGVGQRACKKEPPPPTPEPTAPVSTPTPAQPVPTPIDDANTYTADYQGTYSFAEHYSQGGATLETEEQFSWEVIAKIVLAADGSISQASQQLARANGTIHQESSPSPEDEDCTIEALASPELGDNNGPWRLMPNVDGTGAVTSIGGQMSMPELVGGQVAVTGTNNNCNFFTGNGALFNTPEEPGGGLVATSFPAEPQFDEAFLITFTVPVGTLPYVQTVNVDEPASANPHETATRTLHATLTISR